MSRPGTTKRPRAFGASVASSVALSAAVLAGCGSGASEGEPPFVAVLAAFPAELAALVERARVEETIADGDRVLRVGRLGGVRVVLAMTGIGLVNAEATTRSILDRFPVTGVVVSGVAGAPHRIGDVAVPEAWELAEDGPWAAHPPWLALAREVAESEPVLERCTEVPATGQPVCLEHAPAVFVGGVGSSSDPFGGQALVCQPDGDDVFGCDITSGVAAAGGFEGTHDMEPAAVDMETAAIARQASARGLPYVAFRAVSDGGGDPLGLPGFPSQFFAYYRLAAANAAATAEAFLERLSR